MRIVSLVFSFLLAETVYFSPVMAAPDAERGAPQELLEDATRKVMRALELVIGAIPQYQLPEVLDNGDIIIRRVHPGADKPENSDDIDETST